MSPGKIITVVLISSETTNVRVLKLHTKNPLGVFSVLHVDQIVSFYLLGTTTIAPQQLIALKVTFSFTRVQLDCTDPNSVRIFLAALEIRITIRFRTRLRLSTTFVVVFRISRIDSCSASSGSTGRRRKRAAALNDIDVTVEMPNLP